MPATDEFKMETWTYAGRRFSADHKLFHVWNDSDGDDHYFDKAPTGPVIGGNYEVEVKRHGEGRVTARGIESSTYKGLFGVNVDDWVMEDRTAVAQQEAHRAKQRDAKASKDIGDLTLRQVRDMLASKPTTQRWGLKAQVLEYLG
jgi:hypothetical protein